MPRAGPAGGVDGSGLELALEREAPELAFGVRGDPPIIGPNEALQFDVRLVQIGAPEGFEEGAPVPGEQ
ncbi:MAG: hypothetical protein ACOC0Q_07585 [Wenzhouxiangella sp.]